MYSPGYFCEIHTHPGWYTYIFGYKTPEFWFLNPCLSRFFFFFTLLLVSHTVLGKRVEGVFCSLNPCVFFSSVYVVFECCCVYL